MPMKKGMIGFIGSGNMATALVKGLIKSGFYQSNQLLASDNDREKSRKISEQFGVTDYSSNKDLVRECAIIILSVKPQVMREVLEDVRGEIRDDHLMISIAAGISLKMIHSIIDQDIPLVRVMPNTPALIQKGVSALASGKWATSEHMAIARGIFDAVGESVIVKEEMMDAVTALSGSGPGYIFKIMESFVDVGKKLGFDEETSIRLVVQTVLGAAHLARESEKSLSQLRG
ncbi:MAG: pyrroline-5-carboxylate reductase, partial [Desulfatiglandales bacterium]|nr:pyrroline-5-carboxylate reductase [Desulfatiglandales bacterium]